MTGPHDVVVLDDKRFALKVGAVPKLKYGTVVLNKKEGAAINAGCHDMLQSQLDIWTERLCKRLGRIQTTG